MMYNWERPADTLTITIFPEGKSEYTMYEDDGLTRQHRERVFATTKFEVSTPENEKQPLQITINAAQGDFAGRLRERTYLLDVFTSKLPKSIMLNGQKLRKAKDKASFESQSTGWYFDPRDRKGIVHIKTSKLSTDTKSILSMKQ